MINCQQLNSKYVQGSAMPVADVSERLAWWRDVFLKIKQAKHTPKTSENYRKAINLYIEHVGPKHWPPTVFDVVDFLNVVNERASKITAVSYWAILRVWLNHMAKLNAFGDLPNPAQQIIDLELAPEKPRKKPKGIPQKHIEALFNYLNSLDSTPVNTRDRVMLHFIYRTGARSGEAAILRLEQLALEENAVYLDSDDTKDDEDRQLIFGEKVKTDLSTLLSVLNDVDYIGSWVFPAVTGHGRLLEQPLTVSGVRLMFRRRLKQAGLPMYSVHDLRHTFTKEAIRAKKPLPSIQKQLGHSSPTMVLYYAECFDVDQRRDFCDFGD